MARKKVEPAKDVKTADKSDAERPDLIRLELDDVAVRVPKGGLKVRESTLDIIAVDIKLIARDSPTPYAAAIAEIEREGRSVEGAKKNKAVFSPGRDYARMEYTFNLSLKKKAATIRAHADTKNVKIIVVNGVARMEWTVGVNLTAEQVAQLAGVVGYTDSFVTVTTNKVQTDMFEEPAPELEPDLTTFAGPPEGEPTH